MPRRPLPPQQQNVLRARINTARARGKLKKFDFLVFGRKRNLEAVHCRVCGSILRGLIEAEGFETQEIVNGQTLTTKFVTLATTSLYNELRVILDNQQAYDIAMCTACIRKVKIADLEEIFAAELNAFEQIETREAQSPDWDKIHTALPVAFERDT